MDLDVQNIQKIMIVKTGQKRERARELTNKLPREKYYFVRCALIATDLFIFPGIRM